MVLLTRQMNLLYKSIITRPNSFSVKIKLLQTSKTKSHVCSFFIVPSSHQYSTIQNGKRSGTINLLNRRLLPPGLISYHQLSTSDNVVDKVQGLQTEHRLYYSDVADVSATNIPPHSALPVDDSAVLPASLDPIDTAVSNGNIGEDLAATLSDTLSVVDNIEVPLSTLGLAGWSPVGLVQQYLEFLHVSLGLPWYGAIVLATLTARILLFPVLIKAQQNVAKMSNVMPQFQVLQEKFNKARRSGNAIEVNRYGMEIQLFMKKHNMNPLKSALIPLIQAPVFISFFLALRSMANLPVESFKTGGISWIMDLTVPDPYFITPLVTCATLYIVLKVGAESGIKLENMKLARYAISALPIVILPFTIRFPEAVLCYWCANNFITLGFVSLLKVQRIRAVFNIPKIKPPPPGTAIQKKGFVKGVKEAIEDQKMLNIMADRARIDEIRFKKAGTGPIPRTYSYDPTKPRPAAAAAARKAQAKEYKP